MARQSNARKYKNGPQTVVRPSRSPVLRSTEIVSTEDDNLFVPPVRVFDVEEDRAKTRRRTLMLMCVLHTLLSVFAIAFSFSQDADIGKAVTLAALTTHAGLTGLGLRYIFK